MLRHEVPHGREHTGSRRVVLGQVIEETLTDGIELLGERPIVCSAW